MRRLGILLEQLAQVVQAGRLAHDAAPVALAPLRRRALLAPPRRGGATRLGGRRLSRYPPEQFSAASVGVGPTRFGGGQDWRKR